MINVNTIHILVIYTICYDSLIIQKNTLSYSINHALIKSFISQCFFFFLFPIFHNLKSIQICSQIQFRYAIQLNFFFSIQFSSVNQFCYATLFSYANQFNYALNKFNLCLRYIGYQSHRHGPAGLHAGIRTVL